MKNLQNIIGGERNFIFSSRDDFCGEKNFGEKRRVFKLNQAEVVPLKKTNQEKLGELKSQIDKKKGNNKEYLKKLKEEKERKDLNSKISNIYVEWKKDKNNKEDNSEAFSTFLKSEKSENLIGKYNLSNDEKKLIPDLPIDRIHDIIDTGEKKYETLNISKERREATMGAEGLKTLKNIDFSRILDSEGGIVAAGLALTAIFRMNKKMGYGLLGTIGAVFLGNKATGGDLNKLFGKFFGKQLDNLHLTDIEDNWKEKYDLTDKEAIGFTEMLKLNKKDFIGDIPKDLNSIVNIKKLKEIQSGKNKDYNFEKKPEGTSNKEYAGIVLKFLADKGGKRIVENQDIQELDNSKIKKGFENINNPNSKLNYIWQFSSEEVQDSFSGDFELFMKWGKGLGNEAFQEAKNSGIFDFFKDSIDTFKEIWGNTAILKYEKGKNGKAVWHILDSVNGKGSKSISVESWNATERMITLSYEGTKQTFKWIAGGENPFNELKNWLKNPNKTEN